MSVDRQLEGLTTMSPAQLRAAWRETFRQPPPEMTGDLMTRAIAWRLQERCHGGLPASVKREIVRLTERLRRTNEITAPHDISLKPGTRLVRGWRGRTVNVLVTESGFEFDGRQYRSLTQISGEVTGTHWSGPRFFGLKAKKAPPSRAGTSRGG